jgi:hypothetical protein
VDSRSISIRRLTANGVGWTNSFRPARLRQIEFRGSGWVDQEILRTRDWPPVAAMATYAVRGPPQIRRVPLAPWTLTGIRSECAVVLVDQTTEAIVPAHGSDRLRRRREGRHVHAIRRRETQSAVRPVPVVVIDECPQHPSRLATVGDQEPIEALSPCRAGEALGDRVARSVSPACRP